jgi:tRNA 2-thiouridine synthesizing protein D
MHYTLSTTWGPTDTTRASLPFIFAASALEAGDTVMIMLFHGSVAWGTFLPMCRVTTAKR